MDGYWSIPGCRWKIKRQDDVIRAEVIDEPSLLAYSSARELDLALTTVRSRIEYYEERHFRHDETDPLTLDELFAVVIAEIQDCAQESDQCQTAPALDSSFSVVGAVSDKMQAMLRNGIMANTVWMGPGEYELWLNVANRLDRCCGLDVRRMIDGGIVVGYAC